MNVVTQLTQFVCHDVINKNTTDLAVRCSTGSVEFSSVQQGHQSVVKIGGPKRGGVWGTGGLTPRWGTLIPQRSPGAEPLVGVWGRRPQKLKDITELNLNYECNCIDVY